MIMINAMGRVYNVEKKVSGEKEFVIFQIMFPGKENNTFLKCLAFDKVAENILKYFGDSGKNGKHRGKPIYVTGRLSENSYEKEIEKVVEIEGKKYKIKFKTPVTEKQLIVDMFQFVPTFSEERKESSNSGMTITPVSDDEEVEQISLEPDNMELEEDPFK
ncbi:MAG: hypothetical protein N2043_01430 [Ignavibacterium sp.]|nr:hypothetical protein [Ignavibacterium sp.]